ncbi:uncharacterized protein L969DRAFT_95167 [Mixia osmundae IAM 14324]|uniref:SH3 domain-containing protein n=1 Tax=Mixia osmundae (strain CBS 9802 / IAM 14324 / JCM 22182 / KY 12970) TaxID=764103 RepID=G7E6Z3_MIXOS|nr:uncharacterized protein L969DRAFT_95167 [Mixia osmundae IAM 14324]KEI39014.1 hypothetical protein L969DRAFT_95167 [Mixia osmundae IAM 14324]GAA98603.1 hypothetical protein E5Q_05290 [Mixia osmundae IAM 14324]
MLTLCYLSLPVTTVDRQVHRSPQILFRPLVARFDTVRASMATQSVLLRNKPLLATIAVGGAGWLTAFLGQCVAEADYRHHGGTHSVIGIAWLGIFLQVGLIYSVLYSFLLERRDEVRHQISAFLAITIVIAASGINTGIYGPTSALEAVGVGWLLIIIVDILWLLYFTSSEDGQFFRLFGDPNTLQHRRSVSRLSKSRDMHRSPVPTPATTSGSFVSSASNGQALGTSSQNMISVNSNQTGANGSTHYLANPPVRTGGDDRPPTQQTHRSTGSMSIAEPVGQAKALYAYSANPEDPNEISFTKGEILDVLDKSGKWWRCRRQASSEVGIAPSNYLSLVES